MATLHSDQTFADGNVLSASALTNHVVNATPLATFISAQGAITSPLPADEILIATSGSADAKKITLSNLAAHLPTGTTAVDLAVTGATTLTGALTANGNTILGDTSADTLTVNATSTFGQPVTVSSDSTLGTAAVTGTWARSSTTITVTKTAHGLTAGNSRYFVFTGTSSTPIASNVLNGTYSVVTAATDTFTITVAAVGDVVGDITWYEKSLTLNSTLTGALQGNIPVNVANVEQATGDEYLIRDSSDSNRLKTVSIFGVKAYGNIPGVLPTATSLSISKVSGVTTITLTSHGLSVGDVLWIDAATGVAAAWYNVTEVPTANTFRISAGSGSATSTSNCYRLDVTGCGNVSSAFARSTTQSAMQINFIKKPSSANYALNFSWSAGDSLIYYAVNSSGTSYLDANFIKTVNGFGLRTYRSDGTASLVASGTMNFSVLW